MQAIKQAKDFTGYMILKHTCGAISRVYVGPWYFKGYAADGRTPADLDATITCACGKQLKIEHGRALYGRYVTTTICSDKCTGASGPSCDCQCGGMNHGGKYSNDVK